MAGNYVDAPGKKMFYDADGSVGFSAQGTGGALNTLSATDLAQLNDETDNNVVSGLLNGFYYLQGIIFPELRDIVAFGYRQPMSDNAYAVQVSANTTNGIDGSWTTKETIDAGGAGAAFTAVPPGFRTAFRGTGGVTDANLPFLGVKSIRFLGNNANNHGNNVSSSLHIYGDISASTNRLALWHPTLDQALGGGGLDFGDATRGTTYDKTFRIKNLSATLTANSINLGFSALTDGLPTMVSQLTVSTGGAFGATAALATLAPATISAVCTARLTTSASAPLSVWRQKLLVAATTWS